MAIGSNGAMAVAFFVVAALLTRFLLVGGLGTIASRNHAGPDSSSTRAASIS